jgi:hypothetical protein
LKGDPRRYGGCACMHLRTVAHAGLRGRRELAKAERCHVRSKGILDWCVK